MPAHSEIPNVVEEDHASGRLRSDWFAEQRADDNLRPSRFANHSPSEVIEFALQEFQAF
jgi:hypothetical protein